MISFDSLILKAFIDENKEFLTGARINKIQQPTRRELIFLIRNDGQTKQFYINIDPKMYHICFISEGNFKKRLIEIPQKPPMFCMLLRKYLTNSKIAKINQPEDERILELFFETYNEIGDKIYLCLDVELMGKYSNVILYNTDTNMILGCAHNVGEDKSQVREVYGQIPYTYPPEHSSKYFIEERYGFLKSYRRNVFEDDVNSLIDNYYAALTNRAKFRAIKSEYLTLVNQKLKKCEKSLNEMNEQLKKSENFDKYRLYGDLLMGNLYNLKDFSKEAKVFDYENNQGVTIPLKNTKTIKENANNYYKKYNKSKTAGVKLTELIEENKQNKKYLESVLYSVEIAQNIDELNEIGQELMPPLPLGYKANQRGTSCVSLYTERSEVEGRISMRSMSIRNSGEGSNSKQGEILKHLTASPTDTGSHKNFKILNQVQNNKIFGSLCKVQDDKIIKPHLIEKPEQTRIYIGKNNRQNDYIISKLASDEDLWFHTKDCAGAHVLLKTQNTTDELILECAKLAKENSKGKNSSKIGVIYTKCKYLRKPPKANLGYVTYKNEKEIIID